MLGQAYSNGLLNCSNWTLCSRSNAYSRDLWFKQPGTRNQHAQRGTRNQNLPTWRQLEVHVVHGALHQAATDAADGPSISHPQVEVGVPGRLRPRHIGLHLRGWGREHNFEWRACLA